MDLELADKSVLVTGASRGLGLALARAFVAEGCRVAGNARNAEELERATRSMNALALPGDVTDPGVCTDLVAATLREYGRLDVLVCNVGSGKSVPPGQESAGEWERVLRLNLSSTTNMVHAATRALADARGVVVCISSICGLEALGAPVTYSAAKAALNAYVRGIARPLARMGVRINAVAPGNLLFEGSVWDRRLREDGEGTERMLSTEVALQRLGTPEEIASWVLFLASPRSAFATGSVFVVDGGQLRS